MNPPESTRKPTPVPAPRPPGRPPTDATAHRRGALVAVVVILVLGIAGWWISARLRQAGSIQDCVMQGRRNCAPIGN